MDVEIFADTLLVPSEELFSGSLVYEAGFKSARLFGKRLILSSLGADT